MENILPEGVNASDLVRDPHGRANHWLHVPSDNVYKMPEEFGADDAPFTADEADVEKDPEGDVEPTHQLSDGRLVAMAINKAGQKTWRLFENGKLGKQLSVKELDPQPINQA